MWNFIFVGALTILVLLTAFGSKSRRRRLLANRIPGPKGFVIGKLLICLQGPEKLVINALNIYRK